MGRRTKKANSKVPTATQIAELKALAVLADNDIDTRSVPEIRDWLGAKCGAFFRPAKKERLRRQ